MSIGELNETDKKILSTIRKNPYCKKSKIAELSSISWTTAINSIDKLTDFGMVAINQDSSSSERNSLYIRNEYGYFVGVSIGTSHIKICVLDFSFSTITYDFLLNMLNKDSCFRDTFWTENHFEQSTDGNALWCADTSYEKSQSLSYIKNIVDGVGRFALELSKQINVLLIGFSFPGHIDNKNNIIIRSSNLDLDLKNVSVGTLFTSDLLKQIQQKEINIYFDHNVKASAVAEKTIGKLQSINENCAVLYFGAGLGVSFLLDGMLYRGSTNAAGQVGHVRYDMETVNKCTCGSKHCLEQYIREIFEIPSPKLNSRIKIDPIFVKSSTADALSKWLNQEGNDERRKEFVNCLSRLLFNLSDLLEINYFVFSGKLGEIYGGIESLFQEQMILNNKATIQIIPSELGEYSASKGTAICGYYNLIKYTLL